MCTGAFGITAWVMPLHSHIVEGLSISGRSAISPQWTCEGAECGKLFEHHVLQQVLMGRRKRSVVVKAEQAKLVQPHQWSSRRAVPSDPVPEELPGHPKLFDLPLRRYEWAVIITNQLCLTGIEGLQTKGSATSAPPISQHQHQHLQNKKNITLVGKNRTLLGGQ